MLTPAHHDALEKLAKAYEWDRMPIDDLGVLLWSLFQYYVRRLSHKKVITASVGGVESRHV